LDLSHEGIGKLVAQIKNGNVNITKGASFTLEVVYNECKVLEKWDPAEIFLEYKYVDNKNFAADIAKKNKLGKLLTVIDNKNWGKSMLNNPGFTNLNQAKEMIKTGEGEYFFRARENVDLDLIKEKFADFLKKPKGTYGNLDEIANYAKGNFDKVFGKEAKLIKTELKNGDFSSFKELIFLKDYKK